MNTEVLVPTLPESVADATLVAWHKKAGDRVTKNENLVDLETDKVVLEVPAPESGVLTEIRKENGSIVTGGELLALIDTQATAEPSKEGSKPAEAQASESKESDRPLSPSVRRLVHEKTIDPSLITGTGKSGRITKTDVLDHLKKQAAPPDENKAQEAEARQPPSAPGEPAGHPSNLRPEQRVAMTRLRAKVAERLLQAQQNAAMLTTFNEVDMTAVMELREKYQEAFVKKYGIKLGFMSIFAKACAKVLLEMPDVNARIDGDDIVYHEYADISIAISTPTGLVVPPIHNVESLRFSDIESRLKDLAAKARDGKLSLEEMSGGTFTITNGGIFGSLMSTPIINEPQSAILGLHAIKDRPVVVDGQIAIRPMMYLALSYDHRVIDGSTSVAFLVKVKNLIEDPTTLLLDL